MEYYSAIKKNEITPYAVTWMDLEIIILNEVSQKEKEKYHMISLTWNLKYDTNEINYKTETDSHGIACEIENRLEVAKGWGVGDGWTGSLGSADANYYV